MMGFGMALALAGIHANNLNLGSYR